MSTVYDTRRRCPMCRSHSLPCNDAVHGRTLEPFHPVLALPRPAAPPRRTAADRARALATVAIIVVMLCAGLVAIGTVALIRGVGSHPCDAPPCAPVQYATVGTPPPTLPR